MDFGTGTLGLVTLYYDHDNNAGTPLVQYVDDGSTLLLGTYRFYFDIPANTFTDPNYEIPTRVRVSSGGNLGPAGYAPDGEVEDYLFDQQPTGVIGVIVQSLDARWQTGNVLVTWSMATEIDVVGFNLYRSESSGGARTKLNQGEIPAKAPGSPVGESYEFRDESATLGTRYYYWLETVGTTGKTEQYGPVLAMAQPLFLPIVAR
jgi:hypothetical protein